MATVLSLGSGRIDSSSEDFNIANCSAWLSVQQLPNLNLHAACNPWCVAGAESLLVRDTGFAAKRRQRVGTAESYFAEQRSARSGSPHECRQ